MSLSTLFLAIFLILFGVNALGLIAISSTILGVVALVAGIAIVLEAYHPVTLYRRPPAS